VRATPASFFTLDVQQIGHHFGFGLLAHFVRQCALARSLRPRRRKRSTASRVLSVSFGFAASWPEGGCERLKRHDTVKEGLSKKQEVDLALSYRRLCIAIHEPFI
jgi:hypothetical protein